MATKNLVPRGSNEGKIGITDRKWSEAHFVSGSFDSLSVSNIYGNDGTTNLIVADANSSISISKNNNGTFTIGGGGSGSGASNIIIQDDTSVLVDDDGNSPGKVLFYHDNTLSWELYSDVLKPQISDTVMLGSDAKRIKEIWLSEDENALNIGAAKIKFVTGSTNKLQLANDGAAFSDIVTETILAAKGYLTQNEEETLATVVGRGADTTQVVTINSVEIGSTAKEITNLKSIKTTSNDSISIMPDGSGVTQIGGATAGTDSVDIQTGLIDLKSSTESTSKINFYEQDNTNYITLQTDNAITQNHTLTLPDETGTLATKAYAQSIAQGLKTQSPVKVATTADIGGVSSYHAGNETITNQNTLEALTIDTIALSTNDRVLVKDQDLRNHNGIYLVTVVGDASTAWVLTRASEFNSDDSISGFFTFVEQGATNADAGFVCTSDSPDDTPDGTDLIIFEQFSNAGQISSGTGLTKNGNSLSVNANLNHVNVVGTLGELTVTGLSTLNGGLKIKSAANYTTISAHANVTSNYTLILPADVGIASQVLQTDGGGNLSWVTQTSGGLNSVSEDSAPTLGGNLTINSKNIVGNLIPSVTNTYNIGTALLSWKDMHLSGDTYIDGTLYLGAANKSIITNDNIGNVTLTTDDALKPVSFKVQTGGTSTQAANLILANENTSNTNRALGQVRFQKSGSDRANIQLKSTDKAGQYTLGFQVEGPGDSGGSGVLLDRISIDSGDAVADQKVSINMPLELKNVTGSSLNDYLPGEISFYESSTKGDSKITLKAPENISNNYTLTLPGDAGSDGKVLSVNNNAELSWITNGTSFNVKDVNGTKTALLQGDQFVISDSGSGTNGVNKRTNFGNMKYSIFSGYSNDSAIKLAYSTATNQITGTIEDNKVELGKLAKINSNTVIGNVADDQATPSAVSIETSESIETWAPEVVSDDNLVSQKAVYDFIKTQDNVSQTTLSTTYEFTDTINAITLDENAYQNVTTIELNTTVNRNPNKHLVIYMPEATNAVRLGQTVQLHLVTGPNWFRSDESNQNTQEILVLPNPNDPQLIERHTDKGSNANVLNGAWGGFFNFTSASAPHLVTTSRDDYMEPRSKNSSGMLVDGSEYARNNYDFTGPGPYTLGSPGLDFEDGNEPKSQNANTIKLTTPINENSSLPPYAIRLGFNKRSPYAFGELWNEGDNLTIRRNTGNNNNITSTSGNIVMPGLTAHAWFTI